MDGILIRYAELTLKGKNRPLFLRRLESQVRGLLPIDNSLNLLVFHDHMVLQGNEFALLQMSNLLIKVPGLHSISPYFSASKDIASIKEKCALIAESWSTITYKVETHRSDKNFPIPSLELSGTVASFLWDLGHQNVDVHHPNKVLTIDIRLEGVYIYDHIIYGLGGLPQNGDQKVLVLVSGGMDSIVAAVEMIKKGTTVELIHFASIPYTTAKALQKVKDLAQLLTNFQPHVTLHIVSFTSLQEAIDHLQVPSYNITIMRRYFLKIASAIALSRHCLALVSGESLGQVASQTLESMVTVSEATSMLILRPLLTWSKDTIIQQSKVNGFYEISILPYRDCCIVFTPQEPATKPSVRRAHELEAIISDELITHCIETAETIHFIQK